MLLTRPVLDEIKAERIDLVFRRWQRPTVKAGGRLRTAIGELAIHAVDIVDPATIDDEQARRAGHQCADDLRTDLFRERSGTGRGRTAKPTADSRIYRVTVSYAGEDTRAALRMAPPSADEVAGLVERLDAIDRRTKRGAWTHRTLGLIAAWPGRRAPELAEMEGLETLPFKTDVRKLKELGLTESLAIGYRLSPRGEAVLAALTARGLGGAAQA